MNRGLSEPLAAKGPPSRRNRKIDCELEETDGIATSNAVLEFETLPMKEYRNGFLNSQQLTPPLEHRTTHHGISGERLPVRLVVSASASIPRAAACA